MSTLDFLQSLVEDQKATQRLPLLQRLIGLSRRRPSAEFLSQLDDAGLDALATDLKSRIADLDVLPNSTRSRRYTLKIYFEAALRYVDDQHAARKYNCLACGACCEKAGAVLVNALDRPKVPAVYLTKSSLLPCARTTANSSGRCLALAGDIGKAVVCVIHSHRPDACRNFTAGTSACLSARKKCSL